MVTVSKQLVKQFASSSFGIGSRYLLFISISDKYCGCGYKIEFGWWKQVAQIN